MGAILTYLRIMWQFSPPRTVLFFTLLILSSVTEGVGLILLVPLLGVLQDTGSPLSGPVAHLVSALKSLGLPLTLTGLLGAFLAVTVVRAAIQYSQTIVSEHFRLTLLDALRAKSFDAVVAAQWQWIANSKRSDLSNLLITEIDQIGSGLFFSIRFLVSTLSILAYTLVAFSLSPGLTAIAIILGAVLLFTMRGQHERAQRLGRITSDANKHVQQVIEEGLAGLKLTKILGNEDRHSQLMLDIRTTLRDRTLGFVKLNAATGFTFQILVATCVVLFLYLGAQTFALPIATLLVLIVIFARLAPQLRHIQTHINQISFSQAAFNNFNALMASTARSSETVVDEPQSPPLSFGRAISLRGVTFRYEGRKASVLNDITITIPFQKTTAIMGASGSGKSTLADIITGLLSADTGDLYIDDVLLTPDNRLAWRRSVAYVAQDVFMFHDTIRQNLLWADAAATDDDIRVALQKASADFVFNLPDGLDTIVGDSGMRLSGGERQRIALARAMLQKPLLLILDEATSALDVENEARIRRTLDTLHGDLTVIVIGHRLPTLENADQLIVLEKGQVKSAGQWHDIMGQPNKH
ncbi:ABC transporter ATP-binding protein [Fretibacter rubidus]|uniref:ABC transporter ATP-binding protein n=1 Tax=Fretibacter rubidus TaxID=570162 RepID=UPI00352A8938